MRKNLVVFWSEDCLEFPVEIRFCDDIYSLWKK